MFCLEDNTERSESNPGRSLGVLTTTQKSLSGRQYLVDELTRLWLARQVQNLSRIESGCDGFVLSRIFFGSSDISSDKVSIKQKKTAEVFVYLNNHKQIYKNEQQFSISCMGPI